MVGVELRTIAEILHLNPQEIPTTSMNPGPFPRGKQDFNQHYGNHLHSTNQPIPTIITLLPEFWEGRILNTMPGGAAIRSKVRSPWRGNINEQR